MYKRSNFGVFKRLKSSWIKPEGYDTGVKVFNCITKNKQPLIVKNKNFVTWYTCGPTVYDSAHIGHVCCFVKLDIIQRILREYFKLNLVTVMNVTDVDDKIIARSKQLNISTKELASQYEKEFWKDMESLQIRKPDHVVKVTENMEIIKKFIQTLVDSNFAYNASDNSVYFDVQKYADYGKLQNISAENDGDDVKYKKSKMDFALWKGNRPEEVFWDSNWGPGRPGWHIECSALASHMFGSNVDIHAGGIDLRFPHHENEEAQSCAAHQTTQWVNYWIHTGHLHLKDSEKMSKSLKNTISINKMLENTSPDVFRMACIMSHYQKPMEFSVEFMATASALINNYKNFFESCRNYCNGYIKATVDNSTVVELLVESSNKIHNALVDDFNTPAVVNVLNDIVSNVNVLLHSCSVGSDVSDSRNIPSQSAAILASLNLVDNTLSMLGIDMKDRVSSAREDNSFIEVMNILNHFRQEVRQLGMSTKDKTILRLCDAVRNDLNGSGITVKDHGKQSSWS